MAKKLRSLDGQVVAITGGGRGIGRATAAALIVKGARVAIGDIDAPLAERTAAELGSGAIGLPLDVTDKARFTEFLDEVERRLGPLDVLVNNAGIMPVGRFVDEDDLTARRMVDINIHGVILGTKLALARMIPRDRGHIVNISSQAGKFGAPGGATYSATKHAVVGLPFVVNTELGSGLGEARGMHVLQPSEVADAIVDALQHGTVEVWVPKSAKRTSTLGVLLPRRLSEGMARALKADRVLAGADAGVRKGYELRAARSEPALAPPEEPAQISPPR